jgi:hypothetical protein
VHWGVKCWARPPLCECGAGGAPDLRRFAFSQVEGRFQFSSLPGTCCRFTLGCGLNVACPPSFLCAGMVSFQAALCSLSSRSRRSSSSSFAILAVQR